MSNPCSMAVMFNMQDGSGNFDVCKIITGGHLTILGKLHNSLLYMGCFFGRAFSQPVVFDLPLQNGGCTDGVLVLVTLLSYP